ncbi:MAG: methylmalonyl-CoA mutase family protein [Methylacidiphilales bacterium]|nr:methylmalonyl-CoA mutase family protein [Candidatus Methylacidiphilales bacterium]
MSAAPVKEPLLKEFSPATYDQWKVEAEKLLKGAPFDKKLLTPTHEGITLKPIYNASDVEGLPHLNEKPGFPNFSRGALAAGYHAEPWKISQELPCGAPEEFNAAIRQDLMRGQSEINLLVDIATASGSDPDTAQIGEVGACGTSLAMLRDFETVFRDIYLDCVSLYLRAGISGLPLATLLLGYVRKAGLDAKKLTGCIEMDPIGILLRAGKLPVSLEQAYEEMALLADYLNEQGSALQSVSVQAGVIHDAGGSAVQELGYALATGTAYLNALQQKNVPVLQTARRTRFSFSVGGNFFMEIAKLRAARLLWARVLEAYKVDSSLAPMKIHARTSLWNKTSVDSHVNMLRATTEAFSAVLAGCQSLHVGPYDEVFSVPDEFSRRVARNTQVVLQEECELARVIDPAGGSWYVEWLTNAIAEKAWAFFQDIEKEGGIVASMESGWLQKQVDAIAQAKIKALGQRKEVLVGTNNYPNPKEQSPGKRIPDYAAIRSKRANELLSYRICAEVDADTAVMESLSRLSSVQGKELIPEMIQAGLLGASLGEMTRSLRHADKDRPKLYITPLRTQRVSQGYEKLREAAEKFRAQNGREALVFQCNIGPSRTYRLRADWTTAFFQVGGFSVASNRDFKTAEEAAAACAESGAQIAVICSTDEQYAGVVPALAQQLKRAGTGLTVLVAGAAGDNEAAWKEAGVDGFVNVRANNFETLKSLLNKIGASV